MVIMNQRQKTQESSNHTVVCLARYGFGPVPDYCHQDYARVVVRSSSDKGVTWSNATAIASPVPDTPYECALVDGG
jgi:hypothetical protein